MTAASDGSHHDPSDQPRPDRREDTEPVVVDVSLQPMIDRAIEDLGDRLDAREAEIEVVSATAVVWPDKGLGCPRPGMAYAQVTVDGTLIELRAGGLVYRYHSGGSRPPFLCERSFSATPVSPVER